MLSIHIALTGLLVAGAPALPTRDTTPSVVVFDRDGPAVARFPAAVVAFLASRGYPQPHGTMAVSTDSARQMLWPQVFDSDVPDSVFAGIAPIVRTLVPQWPGSGPVMLSFRLDHGAAFVDTGPPADSVAMADWKPPEWRNRGQVGEYIQDALSAHPDAYRRRVGEREAMIRVLVDVDGSAALAEVPHVTGDPELDKYLPTIALRMRFRPATFRGRPVRSFVNLTLHATLN